MNTVGEKNGGVSVCAGHYGSERQGESVSGIKNSGKC